MDALCVAIEDHSYEHQWWLDPEAGEVLFKGEYLDDDEIDFDRDDPSLIPIEPVPSHESYQDLEDFTARVRDPKARDLLERAIAGRGAFRRFKDTLLEFPDLRESWFSFHDARMRVRAVEWLLDQGLLDRAAADSEKTKYADPDIPEVALPLDAMEIARNVAVELRTLYGERLETVMIFGSWARGDAHPESDIDLLVVLDNVDSVWDELRKMDPILWRHSLENDTVITVMSATASDLEAGAYPALVRAKAEGREVA